MIFTTTSSLVLRVRASWSQVHQELREREEVEKELSLVKGWIQDTRGLLLSPTADLDSLLQDLEVGHDIHKNTTKIQTEISFSTIHGPNGSFHVTAEKSENCRVPCYVVCAIDGTW